GKMTDRYEGIVPKKNSILGAGSCYKKEFKNLT
ncbi:MAG: hypothetical protein ACJAWW_002865, partial [Sulfurimonas sp.]